VLAGPYATQTLGDLGAEVIKVERPGAGDDTRGWGPPYADGRSTYYLAVNRNKRSIGLDLADDGDRRDAVELATRADVVIHNFRPGGAERFGLGYEQLRRTNPGLVYCAISAFGPGTRRAWPATTSWRRPWVAHEHHRPRRGGADQGGGGAGRRVDRDERRDRGAGRAAGP
jgi:crotonobetainyl-CoA:carnitine CoA-transferase CaiB-like acyl-CoA transferase